MKFKLDRCIGIFTTGLAALLLTAMQHTNPSVFLEYLIAYQSNLFVTFILLLTIAAVFLSTEK